MLTKPPHVLMSHQPFLFLLEESRQAQQNILSWRKPQKMRGCGLLKLFSFIGVHFHQLFVLLCNMINFSDQVNADQHLKWQEISWWEFAVNCSETAEPEPGNLKDSAAQQVLQRRTLQSSTEITTEVCTTTRSSSKKALDERMWMWRLFGWQLWRVDTGVFVTSTWLYKRDLWERCQVSIRQPVGPREDSRSAPLSYTLLSSARNTCAVT